MNGPRLSLIVVTFFAAVTAPCPGWSQERDPGALQRALRLQDHCTEVLLTFPGVVGVATSFTEDGQPAIQLLVAHAKYNWIPPGVTLEGVPVVVHVSGRIVALHHKPGHGGGGPGGGGDPPAAPVDPTARFPRPVPIGVSTGHPSITAGTIGCRVTNGVDVFALSNNHVYANENNASIGDSALQPGPVDGGTDPDDAIGTLSAFESIVFSTSASNTIDAAIALSSTDQLGNATPSDGYGAPSATTVEPSLNMKVQKYGRTTGLTKGTIQGINATVDVGYDSGVARFVNQIIIGPGGYSAPGDSGSLIVVEGKGRNRNDDRKAVGLLFAGSAFVTIANPIGPVLSRFGVTVDGE